MEQSNELTIIRGSQGSGKTTLAKQIVGEKKAVWTDVSGMWVAVRSMPEDTEYIVVDGISGDKELAKIKPYLRQDTVFVRRPYELTKQVRMPKLILIFQSDSKILFSIDNRDIVVKTTTFKNL